MVGDPNTNGEFRGGVSARLAAIQSDVSEIKSDIKSLWRANSALLAKSSSVNAQVKIQWGALGFLFATICGLAVKVLFTGGAQ